jgi:UDP-N-acetylmuramyl-tripeptide synthetase
MPVLKLIAANPITEAIDNLKVTGVTYDSREVKKGDAFCCVPGLKVHGNQFIEQAIANGAVCIISEEPPTTCSVPYFQVSDIGMSLAMLADHIYDYPSRKIRTLGVTGTNGKTTTTHLVQHILASTGHKVGLIGTLGARYPGQTGVATNEYQNIKHTTPQASDLHHLLFSMVEAGCTHAAMEVSSHALVQKRVCGLEFAQACLTNISQDHLDFHQTMDNYWRSKRILFEMLNASTHKNKTAVVNIDDPLSAEFLNVVDSSITKLTYAWDKADHKSVDLFVKDINFDFRGTKLTLATHVGDVAMNLALNGRFNVYNVMAAIALCLVEGVELAACKEALENFSGVSGRFEVVTTKREEQSNETEPLCIVDYAHTPDGLENVVKTARALVPPGGKLVTIFGCGGDRDASKRPQMGEIAETYSDQVYVTSDNPRSEDPQVIISNILAGIKRLQNVIVEPDRASAIERAITKANDKDVIVVAGKGHENYQILADRTIHFDDREQVAEALNKRTLISTKKTGQEA